jgi:hypothetical protein
MHGYLFSAVVLTANLTGIGWLMFDGPVPTWIFWCYTIVVAAPGAATEAVRWIATDDWVLAPREGWLGRLALLDLARAPRVDGRHLRALDDLIQFYVYVMMVGLGALVVTRSLSRERPDDFDARSRRHPEVASFALSFSISTTFFNLMRIMSRMYRLTDPV